eukprot:8415768-Pyramimonas_sp.AAC.1
MDWKRFSLTDAKYLHRATTRDARTSIRNSGSFPGRGAERQTRKVVLCFVFGNDVHAASVARREFWLGERGTTMCPQTIPPMSILAICT